MELYSGQGRINLAKRNLDGTTQKRFFFGNVPHFSVNFLTGEIELTTDEIKDETLEIICGSKLTEAALVVADGTPGYEEPRWVSMFEIGDGAPSEYELIFDGINTAHENSRWRVELFRVTTSSSEGWDLISEEFASIKIHAMAHKDETRNNRRGVVYRLHKESVTGNRLTDVKQEIASA